MTALIAIAIFGILLLLVITLLFRRMSGLDRQFFADKWSEIEGMSKTKATWVQAIIDADKLLDEALKQSRFSGKTTAERMVAANRSFSNANTVWNAHKMRNKVVHEARLNLRKAHVNAALRGFERALRDLGAL